AYIEKLVCKGSFLYSSPYPNSHYSFSLLVANSELLTYQIKGWSPVSQAGCIKNITFQSMDWYIL
ncbi:MAG: hypothetical protein ACKVJF_12380, partial [Flavobacteriales bacterium]